MYFDNVTMFMGLYGLLPAVAILAMAICQKRKCCIFGCKRNK